jgi:hypothetical protein
MTRLSDCVAERFDKLPLDDPIGILLAAIMTDFLIDNLLLGLRKKDNIKSKKNL